MDREIFELQMIESMDHVIENYEHNLARITVGRANPKFLEDIQIDYYDSQMPIPQISAISSPESHQLLIKPYDAKAIKSIVETLHNNKFDVQVINEGNQIRIIFPEITLERRQKLVKSISELTEKSKTNIRAIRQKFNKDVKGDQDISEDLKYEYLDTIQQKTDKYIKTIDDITDAKKEQLISI